MLKNDVRESALNQGGGIYEGGGVFRTNSTSVILLKEKHENINL